MINPLIRKLDVGGKLTAADRETLWQVSLHGRHVPARQDLTTEGERPENVHLILSGFACRYKMFARGTRCISALMVPGDFCDLHVAILDERDHSIATMTPCVVVEIPRSTILDLTQNHPRIANALWWATLVDEAVLREWLSGLSRLQAPERIAHFFCELLSRLRAVGLAETNECPLPFTQADLADMLGLTPVHVNRVLGDMRSTGLIAIERRRLLVPNVAKLELFSGFSPRYLHRTPR